MGHLTGWNPIDFFRDCIILNIAITYDHVKKNLHEQQSQTITPALDWFGLFVVENPHSPEFVFKTPT